MLSISLRGTQVIMSSTYRQKNISENKRTNTPLPRAYGLPKLHKQKCPFRPVIPTLGSPLYEISKRLFEILKKCVYKTESYIKNIYEFINKVKKIKIPKTHRIISLDVKSLYLNIRKRLVIKALEKIPSNKQKNNSLFLHNNRSYRAFI